MPVRSAKAQWDGTLKEGKGTMSLGSGRSNRRAPVALRLSWRIF